MSLVSDGADGVDCISEEARGFTAEESAALKRMYKDMGKIVKRVFDFDSALTGGSVVVEDDQKTYTVEQIRAYANSWLKAGLSFDGGVNDLVENQRLIAFMCYLDAFEDSDNIENFLNKHVGEQTHEWQGNYYYRLPSTPKDVVIDNPILIPKEQQRVS